MINTNGNNILRIIKKAAVEAVNNSSPVKIYNGVVINDEPLKIKIAEQEIILDSDFFVWIVPKFIRRNEITSLQSTIPSTV